MRFLLLAIGLTAVAACFNVTDPDHPAPKVDPPVISCAPAIVATDACAPSPFAVFDAAPSDGDADASAPCDAGTPPPQYDRCALPPSVCADSHWAAYFDNGTCVDGTCQLVTKYHYCSTGCYSGACASTGPTFAGRGF